MAYILVKDFKLGLDRKRPRVVGQPGTLFDIANAHLTRGGDIERAKKFVEQFVLPTGTKGLAQVNGQLYVFGTAATIAGIPIGVQYHRVDPGDGSTLDDIVDAKPSLGKLYVVARYSNGFVRHFYDGTLIASLDSLSDSNSDVAVLADYIANQINARTDVFATSFGAVIQIRGLVAGTAFTISTATADGGGTNDQTAVVATTQAAVPAVAEVRASTNFQILSGSVNTLENRVSSVLAGTSQLLSAPVPWSVSNASTALSVAVNINNGSATHGYTASATGAQVTLLAPIGQGATANTRTASVTATGTVTVTSPSAFAGGVTKVPAIAQVSTITLGGTYQAQDRVTVTLNGSSYVATGRAAGAASSIFVYKKRVYATANSLLRYCKLGAPADWTDLGVSSGASFLNLSGDSEGAERLRAAAQYQNYVAIFSRRSIRLYSLETDATLNTFVQAVDNSGTIAPRSVLSYGNTDVFYLDETGIRSIRARDASNAAYVADIGTAIDTFVQAWMKSQGEGVSSKAISIVEPEDGRLWVAIGSRIFVLSYFPSSQIQAWSYYDLSFPVEAMVRAFNKVYLRSGNSIYVYGGVNGTTYPDANEQPVIVKTPFLSAEKPATMKVIRGLDFAMENAWSVSLLVDPSDESQSQFIGVVPGTTYSGPNIGVALRGGAVALNMTCYAGGYASLSAVAIHFKPESAA
jgi:hypothetical protein